MNPTVSAVNLAIANESSSLTDSDFKSESQAKTHSAFNYAQFVKQLEEDSLTTRLKIKSLKQQKAYSPTDIEEMERLENVLQENKYLLEEAKPMEHLKAGDWVQNGSKTPGQIVELKIVGKKPVVDIRWWKSALIDSKSPKNLTLLEEHDMTYVWGGGNRNPKLIRKCDEIECEEVSVISSFASEAEELRDRANKFGQPQTILDIYDRKIVYCQKRIKFLTTKQEISQVNNEQLFLSLYTKEKKAKIQRIAIASIQRDKLTQQRTSLNHEIVIEYAEAMKNGAKFPPIKVMFDGSKYHLYDGFHTTEAYFSNGETRIEAEITEGTQRDAILASVGANYDHGLRRSNADKRKAVMTLLEDEEWCKWSNVQIAKTCKVSEYLVRKIKNEQPSLRLNEVTIKNKHGSITTMNTENIGKRASFTPSELESIPTVSDIAEDRKIQFSSNHSQIKFLPNQVLQLKLTDLETAETALKNLNHQYCIIKGECDIGNGYWVEFPEAKQKRVVMADDLKPVEEVSLTITMSPNGYLEMLAEYGNRENFKQAILSGKYNPYG